MLVLDSFKLEKTIYRKKACFSDMNNNTQSLCSIIVEKEKLNKFTEITEEDFVLFVNDIISWGLDIKLETLVDEYHIHFKKGVNKNTKVFVSTVIRTTYEGDVKTGEDCYYNIFIHYINLKKYFPEVNTLKLFIIANNIGNINDKKSAFGWRGGHMISSAGCGNINISKQHLINHLLTYQTNRNILFSLFDQILMNDDKIKYILPERTEIEYKNLYERIN